MCHFIHYGIIPINTPLHKQKEHLITRTLKTRNPHFYYCLQIHIISFKYSDFHFLSKNSKFKIINAPSFSPLHVQKHPLPCHNKILFLTIQFVNELSQIFSPNFLNL